MIASSRLCCIVVILAACDGGALAPDAAPVAATDAAATPVPDAAAPPDATATALPPPELERWLVGDADDAVVVPGGPGVVLMGGGADVDEAFAWQLGLAAGGDVVVLRTSGADGYNDYLYSDIGGVDSVETMLVTTRALADDAYVRQQLAGAEAIFLAGGDQWTYLETWRGTAVQAELAAAYERGAVLGGTSAGCAVLGQFAFSAENDTVYSDEALADPYNSYMTFERDFVAVAPLAGVITDTHFAQRDRMGRLVAFTARMIADGWSDAPLGVGVDEQTALLVDADGGGRVVGTGAVYVIAPAAPPATIAPGEPLEWTGVPVYKLRAGDTIELPSGATDVAPRLLDAAGGVLSPENPY